MTASDGAGLIAGRYRLISEVGSGAMGVVWLARDERLGRTVAVKELRAGIGLSGTQVERSHLRARREARIAARLQHPHAVAILDVAEHEGRPYLVMEYVPSRSLAEAVADGALLTPAEAVEIGAQLASALIAAHEAGIVHRDIKPGNILLADDGKVKLTDFGISRANDDVTLTGTGEMLGTPAYVAPEVAQGRPAGPASDVFSLGATLYAAVEGEPPFGTGPTVMALLLRIVNDQLRPPERTGLLTDTVLWMLGNDPADRPSMDAVHRELLALAALSTPDAGTMPVPLLPTTPQSMPQSMPQPSPQSSPQSASRSAAASAEAAAAAAAPAEPGHAKRAGSAESVDASVSDASASHASVSDAVPEAAGAASGGSRRRLPPWAAVAVAVALAGGVVAALLATQGPSTTPAAGSSTASATGASGSRAATSASAATSAAGSTAASAATSSAAPASPSASGSPTSVAAQLTSAISSYYKLMPGHLDQAWNYMTADYQQNHAGGMSGYRQFWDQIQSVSASDVVAQLPSTVVATIDYVYKNGQRVEERTSFGLVRSGGVWKIASSSVLSSRTL